MTREERAQRFDDFWAGEMHRAAYAPNFNRSLEAIIAAKKLPLFMRVWAWIVRYSWGNWCTYVCIWEDDLDGNPPRPRSQSDCARELGEKVDRKGNVNVRRVNEVILHAARLSLVRFNGPTIVPNENPAVPAISALARDESHWKTFDQSIWPQLFPEQARQMAELEAKLKPLSVAKIAAYRAWKSETSGNPEKEATPKRPEKVSETGGNFQPRIHKGTRARVNLKQEDLFSGLVIPDEPSSSSSPQEQEHESTTTTHPAAPRMMGKEFHRKLRTQFNGAGKPVPTRKQSDPIYERLAENCGLFLAWLTPRKLKPINHPGALPELLDEFLDTLTVEPPPEPEPTTLKDQIEAWKWIAQNDEDLSIREHAKNELRKLGIEIGKGAS